jgi:hypothetical protein
MTTPIWLRKWTSPCARAHYIDLFLRLVFIIKLQTSTIHWQPPPPTVQTIMVPATAGFTNLPTELILDISDYLSLDAILALKLTQRRLNGILRLDRRRWQAPRSRCTQRAIQSYLAPPSSKRTHQYCILCKVTCPVDSFKSSLSPACLPMANVNIPHDVVELPPKVCFCHVARFTRFMRTGPRGANKWVSHRVNMCMHCGDIWRWNGGDAKCDCKCNSCAIREATTYTRYIGGDARLPEFVFWRETPKSTEEGVGQLWVREIRRDAIDQKSVLNLPVQSE